MGVSVASKPNVIPKYEVWALLISEFEGFRKAAYLDSGNVVTIGFGSTYNYSAQRKVLITDVISYNEAVNWMQFEFQEVVRNANHYITSPLTWNQSTAICDYIYNRGIGNFLKTSLDELINANPNNPEILNQITGTGLKDRLGNLLRGLVRRRKSEAYLYETGGVKFQF